MTLRDYLLRMPEGSEVTVWDNVYDIETYFYNQCGTVWDDAMMDFASKLDVISVQNGGVCVNMSDVIELNLDNISGLFYDPDIDAIMDDMENILAGSVSEDWFVEFVNYLI